MSPKPALPLRDRMREATSLAILTGAEQLLAEQGLMAASMAAIAQRAGVSVGTLYNYFKDKEQLIVTLLEVRRVEIRKFLDDVGEAHMQAPFTEHLTAMVDGLLQIYDQNRAFLKISLETERFFPGLVSRKDAEAERLSPLQMLSNRFQPVIAKGVAEGVLEPSGREVYATTFASLVRGILSQRLSEDPGGRASLSDDGPLLVRLFLSGARRQNGGGEA